MSEIFEIRAGDTVTTNEGAELEVLASGPQWLLVRAPDAIDQAPQTIARAIVRSRRVDFARDFATDGTLTAAQARLRSSAALVLEAPGFFDALRDTVRTAAKRHAPPELRDEAIEAVIEVLSLAALRAL